MKHSIAIEEEITLFKKSIEGFAKKEIEPHYSQWEEDGIFPRELWKKLGDAGLLCVDIPEQYGGLGAPLHFAASIVDELSRLGYSSVAGNLAVHSNIVAHYILNAGTEEQKAHYLPKMASGEYVSAIAMTEPSAGSDLQGIKATAIKNTVTGDYVINGSKTFISNGQNFDFVIAVAKTTQAVPASKGTTLFIVDADTNGLIKGKKLKKIGLHSADTSELFFDGLTVSPRQILGELDHGFAALMQELPRERTILAVAACGAMEGVLEITVQYLHEREAFGKPLSQLQVIRHKIAEMTTEAKVNRAYVNQCLNALEKKQLSTTDASIAKLSTTEAQGRVVDGCLQLFGGYGYMVEYPISRAYTDARVQRIYGGTSEIMKEIISKDILGK
ncbi:acyl-CoA dehydrogenase family protein [Bacillus sp. DTU_2020_1000418_1_SI_GHA_SEK_038]|uniref:acyl-CoA dehydrogenase family protein n=1 Tax=Bacillus sp. DTU_2020_1000418_1_SI_GHA_SEK_038 TaxID=3077585 RepID=UPI0028E29851|nr:acyl-CoA dehydrogenase family protein [Bacillus sp. DTU_2020_1000418_1_SI_GHA_SEK_038]WNS76168.1 acyl-CoA dehydrogenase family protein [Bacillus sp. DTU_2020_1000418_1_SI_GHA_SEK_038]